MTAILFVLGCVGFVVVVVWAYGVATDEKSGAGLLAMIEHEAEDQPSVRPPRWKRAPAKLTEARKPAVSAGVTRRSTRPWLRRRDGQ